MIPLTSWMDDGRTGQLDTNDDDVRRAVLASWLHDVPIRSESWLPDDGDEWVVTGALLRGDVWRFVFEHPGALDGPSERQWFLVDMSTDAD